MANDLKETPEKKSPIQKHYDDEFNKLTSDEHMSKDGKSRGASKSIDLNKAEGSAVEGNGSLYSPSGGKKGASGKGTGAGRLKSAFSGRKKYGWMGGSGLAVLTVVVFTFSMLSAPFQFIHLSHRLQQQYEKLELMADQRLGAHIRHYAWGGKNPYVGSRLGTIGNRISNRIETRLELSGIDLVTSDVTGVLTEIKVDGKTVAEFKNGENNAFRRDVTKAEISKRMGWNKATTALMTRLPFARYDVSLRVLGNVKRKADESFQKFADDVRKEKSERITDTSFEYTENQRKIEELEQKAADGSISEEEARLLEVMQSDEGRGVDPLAETARDAYDNTSGDHNARMQAAAEAFGKTASAAGGASMIAMIVALSCLIDSLADAAKTEAFENVYTTLVRMGGEGQSIGDQIESGIDVDPDELAVHEESLYDPADGTSWGDSAGFGGDVPVPDELKLATRGVSTAANFINTIERSLDLAGGLGVVSENAVVCSVASNPWVGWGLFVGEVVAGVLSAGGSIVATESVVVAVKSLLKELVSDYAVGKTINTGSTYIMSLLVGKVVPPLARGALYGSIVSMGAHYGANEAGRSAGGVSLTAQQAGALNSHLQDLRIEENKSRSFAYRYLEPANPYSMVSSVMSAVSNNGLEDVARNMANIFSVPAGIIGGFFSSNVLAQETDAAAELESGAPSVGFSVEEVYPDDETLDNPFLAEKYVNDNDLDIKYAACFKSPADAYREGNFDLLANTDFYLSPMPGISGCDYPNTEQEFYDYSVYRVHHFDVLNLLSLGCLEGDDVSCRELGVTGAAAGSVGASSYSGLLSPPNLATAPDDQPGGYYHMPNSQDGSYIWNGATPEHSRCGTKALIDTVYTVTQRWKLVDPGNPVRVGDLNEEEGHASHNHGVDVDIFMKNNDAGPYTFATTEDAITLTRMFADSNLIEVIFYNDPAVIVDFNNYVKDNNLNGAMRPVDGHGNHLHVRILEEFEGPYSKGCGE